MENINNAIDYAIAHNNELVKLDITSEADAAQLVAALTQIPLSFSLRTANGRECVNAKSLFGVIYFMSNRNNSYLVCEGDKYENN